MLASSKIPVVAGHSGSVLQPILLLIVGPQHRFLQSMRPAVMRMCPKPYRSAPGRVQSGITSRHLVVDDMSLLITMELQPHFSALFQQTVFTASKNRAIYHAVVKKLIGLLFATGSKWCAKIMIQILEP